MKEYIGNCIDPPVRIGELLRIVEGAKEVSRNKILNTCYLSTDLLRIAYNPLTTFYEFEDYLFMGYKGVEFLFR